VTLGAPAGNTPITPDAVGIDFGVALEGLLDLLLDLGGRGAQLDLDQIADALDALDPAHCGLGRAALVLPLHLAFESHPAVLDDDLDVLRGDRLIAGP
jgi:hypothetical protein